MGKVSIALLCHRRWIEMRAISVRDRCRLMSDAQIIKIRTQRRVIQHIAERWTPGNLIYNTKRAHRIRIRFQVSFPGSKKSIRWRHCAFVIISIQTPTWRNKVRPIFGAAGCMHSQERRVSAQEKNNHTISYNNNTNGRRDFFFEFDVCVRKSWV